MNFNERNETKIKYQFFSSNLSFQNADYLPGFINCGADHYTRQVFVPFICAPKKKLKKR